jgi:hypothetical protein
MGMDRPTSFLNDGTGERGHLERIDIELELLLHSATVRKGVEVETIAWPM